MKATKTINKLHFDDLSFSRFEDMCVQIVYRMDNWRTIQHFGRKGKEKGLDIFTEKDNNKIIEKWYIQCKRYKNISKSQIKIIIDELIEQNNEKPDKYLLILACDVSREVFEYYQKYASSTGIGCVDMITASTLETILYDQHPDILYTFFGINIMNKRIATVARIRRRLRMKQKFQNSFRGIERGRSIIIRDVHRDYVYPDSNPEIKGVYPWFKVEYKSLYHRGVSCYIGVVEIIFNKEGWWQLSRYNEEIPTGFSRMNALQVGNIPFDNIVDLDVGGDEYYPYPHIFCEFNNLGEPYEKIWYEPWHENGEYVFPFPEDKMIEKQEIKKIS